MAFFGLSGLDILGKLEKLITDKPDELHRHIQWIKELYVFDSETKSAGFHGGNFLRTKDAGFLHPGEHNGHIAMTYTALSSLKILGDDFAGLDKKSLCRGVARLQQKDGSFNSSSQGGENDMRFVFCAAAISHLLQDWSGVDQESVMDYIRKSISFDGGIAQGPGLESHGGSTFCAVASLTLMDKLDQCLSKKQKDKLIRWCLFRLEDGFCGRPNKPSDTCYSFWVGATIKMLSPLENVAHFVAKSVDFVLQTQDDVIGGMAKWPDNSTDPLHTYFGLGGLSLAGFPGLREINPAVNVTKRALGE